MRAPAIRLRLDPINPGHFFACCGVLELAHRAWKGAEAWFEEGGSFFCVSPIGSDVPEAGASQLLRSLRDARLTNADMTTQEMQRREELERLLKKRTTSEEERKTLGAERASLRRKWDTSRDGALHLGAPFELRLDWHREVLTGGSRFKTWAGQQAITSLAFALKDAINAAALDADDAEWLFSRVPCSTSLYFDAVSAGSDVDVGFSFDPLKIGTPEKRALVEFLALLGLQRFRPQQVGRGNLFVYSTWFDALTPDVARAAAAGTLVRNTPGQAFGFRLLYRTTYLKSFQLARPIGDREWISPSRLSTTG